MKDISQNTQDLAYVDTILNNFVDEALTASCRAKAIAIMSILCWKSGGYNLPSDLTATKISGLLHMDYSSIKQAVKLLEERKMLFRERAQGRGNRLVITALGPEHWLLPNGRRYQPHKTNGAGFREEKSRFVHQKKPGFHEIAKESVDFKYDDHVNKNQMGNESLELLSALLQKILESNKKKSHEPSKLIAVMGVILMHSKDVGRPCSIFMMEIGEILNHNLATMVRLLGRLEELGFIKREYEGHKKRITTILPDPAPVVSSDAPKEMSK